MVLRPRHADRLGPPPINQRSRSPPPPATRTVGSSGYPAAAARASHAWPGVEIIHQREPACWIGSLCFAGPVPEYRRSPALVEWFGSRRLNVEELVRAHAAIGNVGPGTGPGRPPARGTGQLNEALVLRVMAEFQGFVRDLVDLTASKIVRSSGCAMAFQAQIITAMTRNLQINRGNPHKDAIIADLRRLGLKNVGQQLATKNQSHAADVARLEQLVKLRNALAHDDQDKLASLSLDGVRASKQYVLNPHRRGSGARPPGLNAKTTPVRKHRSRQSRSPERI